jgi:hypothetical protein
MINARLIEKLSVYQRIKILVQGVNTMIIRRKTDVEQFCERFGDMASWDGSKHYITLQDEENSGTLTFMQYPDGTLTAHRKYQTYWDINEFPVESKDIWRYRKVLNSYLKNINK